MSPKARLKDTGRKKATDSKASLRKRAEEVLRKRIGDVEPETLTVQEARRLLHELQVHQIELEMQNEELRLSQQMLDESRQRYADLYDFAPVGYLTMDREGVILQSNLTCAALLGMERARLIKKPLTTFMTRDSQDTFYLHRRKALDTGERQICELKLRRKDGSEFFTKLESVPTEDRTIRTAVSDISERKGAEEELERYRQGLEELVSERTSALVETNAELEREMAKRLKAEKELRRSEEYFRALIENASDIIMVLNPDSTVRYVSPSVKRILGYKPEELIGQSIFNFLHPEDVPKPLEKFIEVLQKNDEVRTSIGRVRCKRGAWRTLEGIGKNLLNEPQVAGVIVNLWDVTAWNEAEEQLRQLTAHLLSVREEERAGVAREVHDELGQLLTTLKLELSLVRKRLPRDQQYLKEKMLSLSEITAGAMKAVRRIASGLRSDVLDHLGLGEAVAEEAREFQMRTGIRCGVKVDLKKAALPKHVSINVFRILQEALTNVSRHAKAKRVQVLLKERNADLILEVCDNGRGIKDKEVSSPTSFGLLGMRERVNNLGGKMRIKSPRGKGTTLLVQVPTGRGVKR